jgi:hypothetical protein
MTGDWGWKQRIKERREEISAEVFVALQQREGK